MRGRPIQTTIEVEGVRQLARESGLIGFLDRPTPGTSERGRRLHVVGWAIGSETLKATGIEIACGEAVLKRLPLGQPRPDVAEAFPAYEHAPQAGFAGELCPTGMARLDFSVRVVLEDDRRATLASVQACPRFAEQEDTSLATLVSIVLIVRDPPAPLETALDSALAQTYPNLEVVVVNATGKAEVSDGARRYPAVSVVECDLTPGAARNAGLRKASGAAVVFLDATEQLLPTALETGLRALRDQSECAFVAGKCIVTRPYHADAEFPQQPLITNDHYAALLGRNFPLSPAAALFRRAPLEAVGGFDESLEAFDDYDLYLRLARAFPVGSHPAPVARSPAPDPLVESGSAAGELERVLEAQRGHVAGQPRLERAWAEGRALWAARRRQITGDDVGDAPTPGHVDFGTLRRLRPLSTNFGFDRGTPVDRYYIEGFLSEHAADIRGHVLEVQENDYTVRFGGNRVEASDVLSLLPDNPRATIVADLACADAISSETFDCLIITQVLHLIREPYRAVCTLNRILKPGGIALVTVPGISQLEWSESWYWSFTVASARDLFSEYFTPRSVRVRAYGNVLAATSFLWGITAEELSPGELDYFDPSYPVTVAVRAVKTKPE